MTTVIGLRPMHMRPVAGQRITVALKDGSQLSNCLCTMIYSGCRQGIVIYHGKKAINEARPADGGL